MIAATAVAVACGCWAATPAGALRPLTPNDAGLVGTDDSASNFKIGEDLQTRWQPPKGLASAVRIVTPTEGSTVRQHFPAQAEYLMKPLAEREWYFDGKANARAMTRDGSRPRPIEIRWTGATDAVRVTVRRLPDGKVFLSETVVGTNAVAVDSLEIARDWELTVADGRSSSCARFRTEDLAPRLIRIEGVPNARDLGGWKGLGGRRIRQGVLFRTSGLNDNPPRRYLPGAEVMRLDAEGKLVTMEKDGRLLHQRILHGEDFGATASVRVGYLPEKARARLTDAERMRALAAYGFRSDVDLRRDGECFGMTGSPLGDGVRWHRVPYLPYEIDGEAARDCNRRVFRFLLDPANHPAVFHCVGGADRTGTVACLLEALLGVCEDDLWKDYLATGFCGTVSNRRHHDMFAHLMYQLRQRQGRTLSECAEFYFRELGFSVAEIQAFRDRMLEPAGGAGTESSCETHTKGPER